MIDVVIATFDRRDRLVRCLAALSEQTIPTFRVTVVDDHSAQPVTDWLDRSAYPFELRVLRTERNSGPAHARNLAVRESSSEYIAFVDDDVVPDHRLLEKHRGAHLANGARAIVIGPLAAPPDWKATPWTRWEAKTIAFEYRRMTRGDYRPTWRQFFTGNAFLRREDFLAAGGFNERFLRAEDIELAYRLRRLGCHFVFEPGAIGWHYSERTLESWRKIPRQYAWSDAELDRLYPEMNWAGLVSAERARRNPATRAARGALGAVSAEGAGASAAILAARVAALAGAHSLASPLMSVAYDLEYAKAARGLRAGRAFNATSTAAG